MRFIVADDHALVREGLTQSIKNKYPAADVIGVGDGDALIHTIEAHYASQDLTENLSHKHDQEITLILFDLRMPNTQPFKLIKLITTQWSSIKLVVLSASELQSDVNLAFDNGARGFIPKSTNTNELHEILSQILKGKLYVPELSETLPNFIEIEGSKEANTDLLEHEANADKGFVNEATRKKRKLLLPETITKRQVDVLKLLTKGKTNRDIAEQLALSECTVKIHVANIFKALEVRNRTEAVIKAGNYRMSRR